MKRASDANRVQKGQAVNDHNADFHYRSSRRTADAFRVLLIGAHYDIQNDAITHALEAGVDNVAVYEGEFNSIQDIALMSADAPCAEGYKGAGYAFYPGMTDVHEEEAVTFSLKNCHAGPHAVRYSYLASSGNNRRMEVQTSAAKDGEAAKVVFEEKKGVHDDDIVDQWKVTKGVVVQSKGKSEESLDLKLVGSPEEVTSVDPTLESPNYYHRRRSLLGISRRQEAEAQRRAPRNSGKFGLMSPFDHQQGSRRRGWYRVGGPGRQRRSPQRAVHQRRSDGRLDRCSREDRRAASAGE